VHELGITQGIIDRARAAATEAGAVGVKRLYLAITPAADFTQDSIEMYFEMLAGEDAFFEGAELVFEWAPADATCLECGQTFSAEGEAARCPGCDGDQLRYDQSVPMIQLTGVDITEPEDTAE